MKLQAEITKLTLSCQVSGENITYPVKMRLKTKGLGLRSLRPLMSGPVDLAILRTPEKIEPWWDKKEKEAAKKRIEKARKDGQLKLRAKIETIDFTGGTGYTYSYNDEKPGLVLPMTVDTGTPFDVDRLGSLYRKPIEVEMVESQVRMDLEPNSGKASGEEGQPKGRTKKKKKGKK